MNKRHLISTAVALAVFGPFLYAASESEEAVPDDVIADQRAVLAKATDGAGYGPQSPRDIDSISGGNARQFETAPGYKAMNLCNIHFHEGAEHKGGEFTTFAGNGDGKGHGTGYRYLSLIHI